MKQMPLVFCLRNCNYSYSEIHLSRIYLLQVQIVFPSLSIHSVDLCVRCCVPVMYNSLAKCQSSSCTLCFSLLSLKRHF